MTMASVLMTGAAGLVNRVGLKKVCLVVPKCALLFL